MTHMITLAACIALTLCACIALEWQSSATAKARNRGPSNMPQSHKHVRYSLWTDRIVITYYNHAGRKVTTRTYPSARYYAVLQSARAKGYRVV